MQNCHYEFDEMMPALLGRRGPRSWKYTYSTSRREWLYILVSRSVDAVENHQRGDNNGLKRLSIEVAEQSSEKIELAQVENWRLCLGI